MGSDPQNQSRRGLVPHVDVQNSKMLFTKSQSKRQVADARVADRMLVFNQNNPKLKGSKEYWRYEQYKSATSFIEFDLLCSKKSTFVDGSGPVVIDCAKKSDLAPNVARGVLFFIDRADSPCVSGVVGHFDEEIYDDPLLASFAVPVEEDILDGSCHGVISNVTTGVINGYLESADVQSLASANGCVRDYDTPDLELFAAAKTWWARSDLSNKPGSDAPTEIPAWFALGCFQKSAVWVAGMKEPISLGEAMKFPGWLIWKGSIEKEIMDLLMMDLWDEVPRSSVPNGQRVNSGHFVFKLKAEDGKFMKAKARYVFGGHRSVAGIDYVETMAHMAALKSIRTVLSLAAPAGHFLRNFDISQAFTFSTCHRDVYMELPPLEKMGIFGKNYGRGRGSGYVAKLKRMIYGQKDAGRAWMNLLNKFFVKIGAVPSVTDSMVYTWSFNGHEARFAVFVDDILASVSDESVHVEFSRLLREEFGQKRVTECPTTWLLGMKVDHDREAKTVRISQEAYSKKLLQAFGVEKSGRLVRTPLPPDPVFQKFEGLATPEDTYRFMVLCGGLQWLQTCSRPDLAFSTNMLARYAGNPSPEHIAYGYRVLQYLSDTQEIGITYHGSKDVLNIDGYDITNKLIGTVDSDLGGCKDTDKSTSGLVLMLNGGAVIWRSSRQSTVSTGTAEAECKAGGFIGQQAIPLIDLLSELGFEQPSVRVLEDNIATVQLSMGTGKVGKSGHFRRMVSYLEGLTERKIIWLDHTPSKENPSDILTKSVTPADQFCRMRDIINGTNPELFVSDKVQKICDSKADVNVLTSKKPMLSFEYAASCGTIMSLQFPADSIKEGKLSIDLSIVDAHGRQQRLCDSPRCISENLMGV